MRKRGKKKGREICLSATRRNTSPYPANAFLHNNLHLFAMNIFRLLGVYILGGFFPLTNKGAFHELTFFRILLGDLSHLASIIILLHKIQTTRSCRGKLVYSILFQCPCHSQFYGPELPVDFTGFFLYRYIL